ncbi:hypothetical protein AB0C76_05575 [Kitasatospora sp. NPDC048722]|uniref:hypothetical protein n=1 Tax=Kitasatospora sp. NPDC048722 TaxID=3155639 RepID=UPI003410F03C
MDIVVVLEPDTPSNVRVLQSDHAPADPEQPVRRAHTAPAEPSGACGPLTMCGLDTAGMILAPHRSTRPRWHTCSTCQTTAADTATPSGPSAEAPAPGGQAR